MSRNLKLSTSYTYLLSCAQHPELFYIGARTCLCDPECDEYYSSSNLVLNLRNSGVIFQRHILDRYQDHSQALAAEQQLLKDYAAVETITCLNLHSNSRPWTFENTQIKLKYLRGIIQDWQYSYGDRLPGLSLRDRQFRARLYQMGNYEIVTFAEHPERLRCYWTTTNARAYWPGRPDDLMTVTKSGPKYYKTSVPLQGLSTSECIQAWLSPRHFVSGQRTALAELCLELLPCANQQNRVFLSQQFNQLLGQDHYLTRRLERNLTKITGFDTRIRSW